MMMVLLPSLAAPAAANNPAPWNVSVSVDKPLLPAGEHATISAKVTLPSGVSDLGDKTVYIIDLDTNKIEYTLSDWGNETEFYTEIGFFPWGDIKQYTAVIGDRGADMLYGYADDITGKMNLASNVVDVQRKPWTLELDMNEAGTHLIATPNQELFEGFYVYIVDLDTNYHAKSCRGGVTCEYELNTYSTEKDDEHAFKAVIAEGGSPEPGQYGWLQAETTPFIPADVSTALRSKKEGEVKGWNPSQICSQACIGDPVNTTNNDFYTQSTDISVPSDIMPLDFSRYYSVSQKDDTSTFGPGWTHNFGMTVEAPHGQDDLSEAGLIRVRQENGAFLFFYKTQTDSYYAPSGTLATFTKTDDGFTLTRLKSQSVYHFNETGTLVSQADRNGNTFTLEYDPAGLLTSVTSSLGMSLDFTYNENGHISQVTDHLGRVSTYKYNNSEQLVKVVDGNSISWPYKYNSKNEMTEFTDEHGGVVKNTYNSRSEITRQVNAAGETWKFALKGDKNVITNPDNSKTLYEQQGGVTVAVTHDYQGVNPSKTSYEYDSSNSMTSVTDGSGNVTSYVNDHLGRRLVEVSPEGRITSATYDDMGNQLTQMQSTAVTNMTYDERGNLLTTTSPEGRTTSYVHSDQGAITSRSTTFAGETLTWEYSYNQQGQIVEVITPEGVVEKQEVNGLGQPTTLFDPRNPDDVNQATQFTYNPAGLLLNVVDPQGRTQAFTYDTRGRQVTSVDHAGNITTATYDSRGNEHTVTAPDDLVTAKTYDFNRQTTSITVGGVLRQKYTYNAQGDLLTSTDAVGDVTTHSYDLSRNRVSTVNSDGGQILYTYDADGNLLSQADPAGNITHWTYDSKSLKNSVTDEMGKVTSYAHDLDGLLTEETFSDSSSNSYTYDGSGRVASKTDAAGKVQLWEYSSDDLRTTYVDTAGRTTSYEYDAAGNNTGILKADGTTTTNTYNSVNQLISTEHSDGTSRSYTYTVAGYVHTETNGDSTTQYEYNAAGRLTKEITDGDTYVYTYSPSGDLLSLTYPSGRVVSYEYDLNGKRTKVLNDGVVAASLVHTDDRLTSISYGNGVMSQYDWTSNDELNSITLKKGSTTLDSRSYGYNEASQVISEAGDGWTEDYGYDSKDRLTTVGSDSSYGYTPVGDLTQMTDGRTLTTGVSGEVLQSATADGVSDVYTYDALGNRETHVNGDTTSTYDWNEDGTLAAHGATEYSYTGSGLLRSVTDVDEENQLGWSHAFNMSALLQDSTKEYVYGIGAAPILQIDKVTGELEYLHADALGSVTASTDAAGTLVGQTRFSPYGTGSTISAFGFTGAYHDSNSDLYYMKARWYDPHTGSFISVDPLVAITGAPYSYAVGNPLSNVDPLGLVSWGGFKNWVGDAKDTVVDGAKGAATWTKDKAVGAGSWVIDKATDPAILGSISSVTGMAGLILITTPLGPVLGSISLVTGGLATITSVYRGEYLNVAINAVSIIPGIGALVMKPIIRNAKAVAQARDFRSINPNLTRTSQNFDISSYITTPTSFALTVFSITPPCPR